MIKVDKYYKKPVEQLIKFANKNTNDIKKMIIFDTQISGKPDDYEYSPEDELKVAIYLENPTQDKIDEIGNYIEDNIPLVYPCMIDEDIYEDNLSNKVLQTGVELWTKTE